MEEFQPVSSQLVMSDDMERSIYGMNMKLRLGIFDDFCTEVIQTLKNLEV